MLKIGNLNIPYRTVLSPMASLTDIVFRQLMDEIGYIGFMVTEMISAEGVRRKNKRTRDMLETGDFKIPQFIQLFGTRPESFSDAVQYIRDETRFSGIDINMGCPVKKITKRGAGAALLKNPSQAAKIIRAIRKKFSLPLTVKIRLTNDPKEILDIIRIVEGEGVDAISIHFRFVSDRYSDNARWEYAPTLREKIRTSFIGNGDLKTAQDAVEKLKIVDGVMIGREALRNPLIFAQIHHSISHYSGKGKMPGFTYEGIMKRLLELIAFHCEPEFQLRRLKAYTRFIVFRRSHSKRLREKIYTSATFEEAREHFNRFYRLDST